MTVELGLGGAARTAADASSEHTAAVAKYFGSCMLWPFVGAIGFKCVNVGAIMTSRKLAVNSTIVPGLPGR